MPGPATVRVELESMTGKTGRATDLPARIVE